MPRIATLTPSKDKKKNLWYVSIPADLSATGKWRREYFRSRDRASELKRIRRDKDRFAAKASATLIRDAVECDDLAQIYGVSGMREAFLFWSNHYGNQKTGTTFCQLLDAHEADHAENWSYAYLTARWRPFRKKMIPIENDLISLMDTAYWREWAAKWREESGPAPTTYNQTLGLHLFKLRRLHRVRDNDDFVVELFNLSDSAEAAFELFYSVDRRDDNLVCPFDGLFHHRFIDSGLPVEDGSNIGRNCRKLVVVSKLQNTFVWQQLVHRTVDVVCDDSKAPFIRNRLCQGGLPLGSLGSYDSN